MLPSYKRLSEEELLKRCAPGLTQNQNESFNATLWQKCSKERYFGTAAVRRALSLAILSWNSGGKSLALIMKEMGIQETCFTSKAIVAEDNRRLSHASREVQKRKKRRDTSVPTCGDYLPGGH